MKKEEESPPRCETCRHEMADHVFQTAQLANPCLICTILVYADSTCYPAPRATPHAVR